MKKIKELLIKYKEVIMYLIFGVLTTLVSLIVFYFFTKVVVLAEKTIWANVLSNAAGILFAYFTNRRFVFNSASKGKKAVKEFGKFVVGRLLTVGLDLLFVYVAVDVLLGNSLLWKLVSTVVVIILNYLISKFIVFTKNRKKALNDAANTEDSKKEEALPDDNNNADKNISEENPSNNSQNQSEEKK